MKYTNIFRGLFLGMVLIPKTLIAQVDFNKTPNDKILDSKEKFQEYFFDALQQKGIENYDRAVVSLLKCVELDDSESAVYFELGKNYIQLQNFGAAENALKLAIDKNPNNEWYLNEIYGVYEQIDDYDNALKTIKVLTKYHPDYEENLAHLYFKHDKSRQALKVLDDMDNKYGYAKSRDYLRNEIYNARGDDQGRIQNLEKRIALNPGEEQNYLVLIYRYSQQNNKIEAFKTAQKLLKNIPSSILVHLALYKFYLEDNDTEKAINSMGIVLKSTKVKPEAKNKVLNDFIKFVQNRPEYEGRLLEITTKISADSSVKPASGMAQYYLEIGDKAEALSLFKSSLKNNPDDFKTIKNIVLIQIDLELFAEAIEFSTKMVEFFPTQPILYLANGVANNQMQFYQEALGALEIGIDYVIDNKIMEIDFYKQLSISHRYLNNIKQSQSFSKKAEALLNGQ
ncbi:hypothetical protein N8768_06170 [Flavobacteriaceae bacterium]|jgi:tetratricopeptide (TPR) repeat protein|nr:hypothetical protein [Flavobacteriaceae bacterium]